MTARYRGLPAWLLQRATAVYIALYVIYLVAHFTASPPASYEDWQNWVALPLVTVTGLLFFAALLVHAWIGLQNVIVDYVSVFALRLSILSLLALGLVGMGVWILKLLLIGTRW